MANYHYDIDECCYSEIPEPMEGEFSLFRAMREVPPTQDAFCPQAFDYAHEDMIRPKMKKGGNSFCKLVGASVFESLETLRNHLQLQNMYQKLGKYICKGTIIPQKHGPVTLPNKRGHQDWFQYEGVDVAELFQHIDTYGDSHE